MSTYYLVTYKSSGKIDVVRKVAHDYCFILASSTPDGGYDGGSTLWMVCKDAAWYTAEEICPKDFPLYVSSLKYISEEFINLLKGL